MPQASARRLPFGHPRICSQITGDSALQCWSGCEISPRVHHFCSRPCGRGDEIGECQRPLRAQFLLTPLREGRPMRWSGLLSITMYFYSRPCGRGDSRFRFQQAHDAISTHAPAGGATLASEVLHIDLCISTHAPAGGATRPALSPSRTENISTHAPAGGATRPAGCSGKARPISTHAPAGGATKAVCHRHVGAVFLLTPLREGRPMRGDSPIFCYIFLLTPLREGRQNKR